MAFSPEKILQHFDAFQQRHAAVGFPLAVVKRYGDDKAGSQAALITYYGFLSLFPLLLVLVTVLSVVLGHDGTLRARILHSALSDFPVIGDQLQHNVHSARQSGVSLLVGLALSLYGGLGVAASIRYALNSLWKVPERQQPGFPSNILHNLAVVVAGGFGLIISSLLSNYLTSRTGLVLPVRIISWLVIIAVNFGLFLLMFRLATARRVEARGMAGAALASAVALLVLQAAGSYIVQHQIHRLSATYGTFAIVLGLLGWIYIQVQVILYAVEAQIVLHKKLWPVRLAQPPAKK